MSNARVEVLKNILSVKPEDSFARYGLAMEHVKAGDFENAVAEFRNLISYNPDYCYAYFHGAQGLEKLGRAEEARQMYRAGIEAASRTGDEHARSELEAALDLLG
jgi:Tfp pilus assembly protein PilF